MPDATATIQLPDASHLRIDAITDDIFRLRLSPDGTWPAAAMNRYGFIDHPAEAPSAKFDKADGRLEVTTPKGKLVIDTDPFAVVLTDAEGHELLHSDTSLPWLSGEGFQAAFTLADDEKIYGLGDSSRKRLQHRGHRYDMWVTNVKSYIPVPLVFGTRGAAVLVNTTWRHTIDLGQAQADRWSVHGRGGRLDLYLTIAPTAIEAIERHTLLTGRPPLPPKYSFGMWYIMHTQADAFKLMDDALKFRDRKLPCDVLGVEPGWMETFYDLSTDKKWDYDKFPLPRWAMTGKHTFQAALKRMGYRFEQWMVCDYDLSFEAERRVTRTGSGDPGAEPKGSAEKSGPVFYEGDTEMDHRLAEPISMDKITKPEEPFFEHLKQFVDQGADFFKQDGGMGVCEHPDRLWGNGMTDLEMHNLYGSLYCQQMYEGFAEHTSRRPVCFISYGWAGLQRYTGTWTGDTGGEADTLVACLNMAMTGHSFQTCDMEITTPEGLHYGFLMTWAQINSWHTWREPWLLGDKQYPIFESYSRLRSRLVPYIYSYAREAARTGMPVMRPLPLAHPGDDHVDDIRNQYYLGRDLMVTAFDHNIYLPEGEWVDWWTGERYEGPTRFDYEVPEGKGGGLFVRPGAIVPLGPVRQYVDQEVDDETLTLLVVAGGESTFELYEDDGISFEHEKGAYAVTTFTVKDDGKTMTISATPRRGSYEGMPRRRRYKLELLVDRDPAGIDLEEGEAYISQEGHPDLDPDAGRYFSPWAHADLGERLETGFTCRIVR